jgi:hypothetical protein
MSEEDKQGKKRRLRVVFEEDANGEKRILREIPLPFKKFSSGSDGFYGSDKIPLDNGERYQVSVIMTRIGSKPKALKEGVEEESSS